MAERVTCTPVWMTPDYAPGSHKSWWKQGLTTIEQLLSIRARYEIMRLCRPLALPCRDALLRILAHELRGRRDVGDGELHRIARTIIRDNGLFDPPLETEPHHRHVGKYAR
jgi:hypothetical protein